MIAEEIATMKVGGDRGNQYTGGKSQSPNLGSANSEPQISRREAAELMNVSKSSIDRARTVKTQGTAKLNEAVKT
jgi:hypothetical protein